jgi:hypothetical protein
MAKHAATPTTTTALKNGLATIWTAVTRGEQGLKATEAGAR